MLEFSVDASCNCHVQVPLHLVLGGVTDDEGATSITRNAACR